MSVEQAVSLARPKRPFSVWLIAAGNTALAIFLLASSFKAGDWNIPAQQIAFWAVLGLALWISTVSTWLGSRWGRVVMLALVTLFMGAVLVQAVGLIMFEAKIQSDTVAGGWHYSVSDAYMMRLVGRAAYSLAWLIANYWLLFSKRARAFYA